MRDFESTYRPLMFWTLVAITVIIAATMLIPFIPAIMWAIVLTILIRPFCERLQQRMPKPVAAGVATFATMLLIGIPLAIVGLGLFVQVNGFVRELQSSAPTGQAVDLDYFVHEIDKAVGPITKGLSPNFSFEHWFNDNRASLMNSMRVPLGKAAYSFGYTIFTFVIAFLTMFFMLKDGDRLLKPSLQLMPLSEEKTLLIYDRVVSTVRAVFIGVVLVALIQGTVAGITYYFTGVPNAVMWGVATIVLCTIPLLGAPIVYIPMALLLIATGKPVNGIILALIGFIVVSNIDNVLRPFIIGSKVELHPMAVFFSLLGGVLLFGPVGIMAGPMVLTLLLALQDIIREARAERDPDAVPGA